ncbi:hypothetical protein GGI43DRAFT_432461 [Trichoderma evansii]
MTVITAYMTRILAVFLLLSLSQLSIVRARNLGIPLPTPAARLPQRNGTEFDKRADIQTEMSTCGFQNGDLKKMRTANPGFDCRVDTMNGLWGFCPVTVGSKQFCSTALLTFGVDQTYSYIACGGSPKTDHYLISPTSDSSSTTTQSSSTKMTAKQTTTSVVSSSSKSTDASPGNTSGPATASTTDAPAKETNGSSGSTISSGSSTNNTRAIIGGVIGGIALLCLSGIASVFFLRRNRSRRRQTLMKGAQRNTHQSWYDLGPKTKHRFTGGWGPRELPGSSYDRTPDHPIELPS